ncbi:MAG TPA: TolC family protein [Candidatus Edwardsbacteria bacterium]|nr:TolC family protein [Candidatus Edwardsbacteria bacterium]
MKRTLILVAAAVAALAPAAAAQPAPTTYSLQQCLAMAFTQSPDLAKAGSNLAVSTAGLVSSIGGMLPHVTASSSYSQSGRTASANPLLTLNDSLPTYESVTNSYSSSVGVSQTLVNLPVWSRIGQSAYSRRAAGATYDLARATLSYNVKQAYYNLVKLQKALRVSQAAVDQSEQQARQARLMNQLGSMSRADLLKIEVQLTQSKVNLLNARTALISGQQALATLIGTTAEVAADTILALPDTARAIPQRDTLMRRALEVNPSYVAARNSYRAAALGAWSSLTSKLPSLSGSYSYGYSNYRQYRDPADWNLHDGWTVGLSLNWNIFDGFITEAGIRQAFAQKSSARADLFTAQQNVASQIDQAHLGLITAREGLSLVGTLLQQAEEDYRLTSEKYRLGSASVLDLLTSQVTFNTAQQTATNAICDYYLAEARLQQVMGQW